MTYSGDPSDSYLDAVRDKIGDISNNASTEFLTDEEIEYELSQAGDSVLLAAYKCCRKIAARYAIQFDKEISKMGLSKSQIFDHFTKLSKIYETEYRASGFTIAVPTTIKRTLDAVTMPTRLEYSDESRADWPLGDDDLDSDETEWQ